MKDMRTVGLGGSMTHPDFVRAVFEALSARAFSEIGEIVGKVRRGRGVGRAGKEFCDHDA